MNTSIGSVALISQHHERQTAEIYQMLDTDPFAEWVILPPFWILGVYFFMEINIHAGKKLKKVQDDRTVHVHSFTQM